MDQNDRVFKDDLHSLWIAHKIGRKVAAVKLHSLDNVKRRLKSLGLFHCDYAVFADFFHRLCDDRPNGRIVVCRDCSDLGDHIARNRFSLPL